MDPEPTEPIRRGGSRLWRLLKWSGALLSIVAALAVYSVRNEIRTLSSLRRVGDSNAYMIDYYCDYHLDELRENGVDLGWPEGSLIEAYFSQPVEWLAKRAWSAYVPRSVQVLPPGTHRCSTVAFQNGRGEVIFGRNFDWMHNASLTVRIHRAGRLRSVATIDLAYLNLDHGDLEKTSPVQRLPLLFAPYYLMDGMNSHGLAIADMSLEGDGPTRDPAKPDLLHSVAMRLILDYATTVDEAIALLGEYNMVFAETPTHLMIADAGGESAVIEFAGEATRVTRSDRNWQVCTNSRIWGATEEECDASCDRYRSASQQLEALGGDAGASEIMDIMGSVAADDWTIWSSVYNLSTGEFLFAHRKPFSGVHREQLPFSSARALPRAPAEAATETLAKDTAVSRD